MLPESVYYLWGQKNEMSPENVSPKSCRSAWWRCSSCGKEGTSRISEVVNKGNRVCRSCTQMLSAASLNSLESKCPELAKEWNYSRNKFLPSQISSCSNLKMWWIGRCGHEWEAATNNRYRGDGCPFCSGHKVCVENCLATTHPKLSKEWHPTKNGNIAPTDITAGSKKKIWWKKSCGHEWDEMATTRINNKSGCPFCSNHRVDLDNCLATTHPKLSEEWHPTKNNIKPTDITAGSGCLVWWKCNIAEDHEWEAAPATRISDRWNGNGCPCCRGLKVVVSNCLSTTHPHLVKEWHPTKNGKLTPYDIVAGSRKKVWWKCPIADDHEWEAVVFSRSRTFGCGCPCCYGKKAVESNCLATTHPRLIKEWNFDKNNFLPTKVVAGSNKLIWWKCKYGHEWKIGVNSRTSKSPPTGCPQCNESKGEKRVAEILNTTGFKFVKEFRFMKCRDINPLPFDFLVYRNNHFGVIEYQGHQHFKPISFGARNTDVIKMLKLIKHHDVIKRKWCYDRKIPFLEIPYWCYSDVENLIEDFLVHI